MRDGAPAARQRFVDAATRLFAERGYHGVSIAAVSAEMGLTKQALIHHFGTKEKLYGEVLQQLAERFEEVMRAALQKPGSGRVKAQAVFLALYEHMANQSADARIIVRELLDNVDRAAESRKWYLRPFLDSLAEMCRQMPGWQHASQAEIDAAVYQLIGAINYFAVSGATLARMFGPDRHASLETAFPAVLARLLDAPIGTAGVPPE